MDLLNKFSNLPTWQRICLKIIIIITLFGILFFIFKIGKDKFGFNPLPSQAEKEHECLLDYSNPYDEGTGHYAGWKWAEENLPDSCGGNSASFYEGCEESKKARQQFQKCMYDATINETRAYD